MTKLTKDLAIYTKINPNLWESFEGCVFSALENSGICTISRDEKDSTLSIGLTFVVPGGDRESAFKVMSALEKSSYLATLPSEDLRSIAYTPDLIDEWKWQRFWSLLLAKCFLLLRLQVTEGLLDQEKQEAPITQRDAELIELSAYRYEALYRLIKKGFKYLRKSLPNDLVNKTYWDLFREICREEIDFHFEIRTSIFQEFLIDTWIPHWKELAAQTIRNREDLTPLLETQQNFHSERLLTVLEIFVQKAKRDKILRAVLTTYFNHCINLADAITGSLGARDSSGKVHKSEQWRHGERYVLYNNQPLKPCYKT